MGPLGVYEVSVHLLDWDEVPSRTDDPGIVVLIGQSWSAAFSDCLLAFGR